MSVQQTPTEGYLEPVEEKMEEVREKAAEGFTDKEKEGSTKGKGETEEQRESEEKGATEEKEDERDERDAEKERVNGPPKDNQDEHQNLAPVVNILPSSPQSQKGKGDQNAQHERDLAAKGILNDELALLQAQKNVDDEENSRCSRPRSHTHPSPEPEDAFNPQEQDTALEKQKNKEAALYKLWLFLRKFPRIVRYFIYLLPGALILLVPVLLGYYRFGNSQRPIGGAGGVPVMWFGIWLEIVWCSLWVTRMITNGIGPIFEIVAKVGGSINAQKWKDVGKRLELPTALFLWFLAMLISFKPIMDHRAPIPDSEKTHVHMHWADVVYKVIIALFVLACLNWLEKILIQWIASSFHQRTYATRIANNNTDIDQLTRLFEHAQKRNPDRTEFWRETPDHPGGEHTPLQTLHDNARHVFGKFSHAAGRVGNDLIGRKVNLKRSEKIVQELLRNKKTAESLARSIYRSLVREGRAAVHLEDLEILFLTREEAEAAFSMFDRDENGDICVAEFEAVCYDVHLEKKAIAASLKDLDSVIRKLDKVFIFVIVIIAVIVFVSILSNSAAAGLASAGTSFLGLAWMLQATAQEFLQSIIFVFVKHPFDVGDRVTIYGSTGAFLTGDDYYVTEVSLLYTEFKKMQGHIVQAPNSLLNTLFILNQRRSNGLSDVVPLQMRFGTSPQVIEELKSRMLAFVKQNKRDYQPTIITEMTGIGEVRSCNMNIVFFHKSSFQNEIVRLNRHNKFVTELMYQMSLLQIEDPLRVQPGGSRDCPVYWASIPPPAERSTSSHSSSSSSSERESRMPRKSSAKSMRKQTPSVRSERGGGAFSNMEVSMGGFQDVYENRRDQVQFQRMESIREKERGLKREAEEEEAMPRASMTSALQMHSSMVPVHATRSRTRIFGRARSRTVGHSDDLPV